MLEADGQADEILRRARLRALARCPMLDQAFDAAERGGAREEPDLADGLQSRLAAAAQLKRKDAAEGRHLPLRDLMPRVRRQTRIVDRRNPRKIRERDRKSVV